MHNIDNVRLFAMLSIGKSEYGAEICHESQVHIDSEQLHNANYDTILEHCIDSVHASIYAVGGVPIHSDYNAWAECKLDIHYYDDELPKFSIVYKKSLLETSDSVIPLIATIWIPSRYVIAESDTTHDVVELYDNLESMQL